MTCGLACFLLSLSSSVLFWNIPTTIDTSVTTPIVDLGYAQYQGSFDAQTNITSFLGIRYAAPPIGHLRFQAPQPPDPESGVQPAIEHPSMCYQAPWGHEETGVTPSPSEDCLFLSVYVPGTMPTEPVTSDGLPVLVWIYGGAFMRGYAAKYDGASLVAASLNGAVVVVIQYRVGVFGFLSGNEVKAQGALNAGLLDQVFALKWVQTHIGLFGGDKDRVTIWGQSAGGSSVVQHTIADGGNTQPPLFKFAIASSPSLLPQYDYNHRVPQRVYSEVVATAGCASSVDTFACLQSVDVEAVQSANRVLARTFIPLFVPVVDGTFIVERPTVMLAKGQVNGDVLLVLYNEHEGKIFVNPEQNMTIIDYVSQIFPDMTSAEVQEAVAVYEGYGTEIEQAAMVIRDALLVCPTYPLVRAFAGRSWAGQFAVPPAYHGGDSPYYFYDPSDPPSYNNIEFVRAFSQSFMSVVKHGDVNVKIDPTNITPYWSLYADEEVEMLFNRTEAGEPIVRPVASDPAQLHRCAFWSSLSSSTAQ